MPRSLAASTGSATALPAAGAGRAIKRAGAVRAIDVAAAKGWDGKRCTLPSTTPPGWHTEVLPDEKKESATAFLDRALGFFNSHGVSDERVITDNGSACTSRPFKAALTLRGIRHKRTMPTTPRTNGKAEH